MKIIQANWLRSSIICMLNSVNHLNITKVQAREAAIAHSRGIKPTMLQLRLARDVSVIICEYFHESKLFVLSNYRLIAVEGKQTKFHFISLVYNIRFRSAKRNISH